MDCHWPKRSLPPPGPARRLWGVVVREAKTTARMGGGRSGRFPCGVFEPGAQWGQAPDKKSQYTENDIVAMYAHMPVPNRGRGSGTGTGPPGTGPPRPSHPSSISPVTAAPEVPPQEVPVAMVAPGDPACLSPMAVLGAAVRALSPVPVSEGDTDEWHRVVEVSDVPLRSPRPLSPADVSPAELGRAVASLCTDGVVHRLYEGGFDHRSGSYGSRPGIV